MAHEERGSHCILYSYRRGDRGHLRNAVCTLAGCEVVDILAGIDMSRPVKPDPISYPPRGLSRDEAARYVGVSPTKFDLMVSDRRMPRPKRVDGRVIWDRMALDIAFAELPDDAGNEIDEILSRRQSAA